MKSVEKKQHEATIAEGLHAIAELEGQRSSEGFNRSASLLVARDRLFLDRVEEITSKVFKGKIEPSGYALKRPRGDFDRQLSLILSDLHFQSLLNGREHPIPFGAVEEARRLAQVILQTVEYKPQYRKNTLLNLHLLGDIIQGQLHDMRDGAPLAEQCAAAIWLLSQAISYLAQYFPEIRIRCATGNHGRFLHRHQQRAIHQKWDSAETVIYFALKQASAHLPNVKFEIVYTPYYAYQCFDKKAFATHGDTVLNPGNPGSNIQTGSLEQQIDRINAALPDKDEYALFFVGHVHIGNVTWLPNGARLITNGCLIPPDDFSIGGLGRFESTCGQMLWESVKGHIVGDVRFITVDRTIDKDRSLDKIIHPFTGL